MNYNNDPYPTNIDEIISKGKEISEYFSKTLNDSNCPNLKELFINKKNKMHRNIEVFKKCGNNIDGKGNLMGLYVFGEEIHNKVVVPVYVGISRNIYNRLRSHGWAKHYLSSTLATLIADNTSTYGQLRIVSGRKKDRSNELNMVKKREDVRNQVIQNYKVAIFPINNDYEMFLLEVLLAGIMKTKWNSFKTS